MAFKKISLKYLLFLFAFLLFFFLFFFLWNWREIFFYLNPEFFWQKSFQKPKEKFEFTEKENSIEIPSLEIFAPLVLVNSESEIEKGLEKGVVLHPKSVFPPNPGRTIILGHSTQHRFSKKIAIFSFTYLPDLKEGDEIILNLNKKSFHYFVVKKFVAKEGEDLEDSKKENLLYLVTCWPPGRLIFKERFVVLAKMK